MDYALELTGELSLQMIKKAYAESKIETGWYATKIILTDESEAGKVTCTLSYNASVQLLVSLVPSIKALHKRIYDKGNGEYKFDDEAILSILNQEVRSK